jgi:predicted TIM-barrel fold metal-dependent hydrolase
MSAGLFDRHRVIDVDTHVSEPHDVWTSRVASKWGDLVPHVIKDPEGGPKEFWAIGDDIIMGTGVAAMAEFDGMLPDHPNTLADAVPGAHDAKARLTHMDREGIYAQVLYPNVGGFGSGGFLRLKEPELMLECVRAYNDFLVDWSSADPKRLVPVLATPFWDVEASVKEIERCAKTGHKAVLFGSQLEDFGQPRLTDRYWDPVWAAAQAAELSISFHIGSGDLYNILDGSQGIGVRAGLGKIASLAFMGNSHCIADLIFGGICHRFPRLKFVSIESGAGWIPSMLETFDWQWENNWVRSEHPEYELKPSEYFRRQIYACFWFEDAGIRHAIDQYPDNILYETDYPHPTSMSPGPQSIAEHPRDYVDRVLGDLPDDVAGKVLHDTSAEIYHLE